MRTPKLQKAQLIPSIKKTTSMFMGMLPILVGIILLTGLMLEFLPLIWQLVGSAVVTYWMP